MTKLTRTPNNPPAKQQTSTEPTAPTSSEVAIRTRDLTTKLGPNDKPVEIWLDDMWLPAYMSCVRRGDFYRFLDMKRYGYAEGACFLCKESPTVDYRYSNTNPTIHMGVAEIQQAAPTVDRTPKIGYEPAKIRGETKHYTTLDDAGFTESPPRLPALPSLDDLIADDNVFTETRVPRSGLFDHDESVDDVDFKDV